MNDKVILPDPPERPLDSDCCGNGCMPCILDIYEEDLCIWQSECEALQKGTGHRSAVPIEENQPLVTLDKNQYNKFTITRISEETRDTLRIRFFLQSQQNLGLAVCQHLIIRSQSLLGSTITRQFTPVSSISTKGYFEILIKVYRDGRMSKYVKDWKVGDQIDMRGPFGCIDYIPNKFKHVLMLCAGTGIAPMCQVIDTILENEEDETRICLLYACRTYQDILAKSELDEWQRYWNFSSLFILSQEPESPQYSYKYGDAIHRGRIDRALLSSELEDKLDNILFLICGTSSFDSDMLMYLENFGIPQSQVHKF